MRCVVRLTTARGVRELIVTTELGGGIRVFEDRDALPHRARAQLAFHDVASGRVIEIASDELHIFDLSTIEMLPDAPGVNDALYLYGAMRGPYPACLGTPVAAVDGQLTVTRADLLSGLLDGIDAAFHYAPDPHGSRCVHALLPAERGDLIRSTGLGIVLALPLVPGWLMDCPVPNDQIAAQILYDVLTALRGDLGLTSAPPLPVPSRAALEARLAAAGWEIEGDTATRGKGFLKGEDRRVLPRQGTLDDFVTEATGLLARMKNVPTDATLALRGRTGRPHVVSPAPVIPSVPSLPPPQAPRPRVETPRTEWMKDFVEAHRQPSHPTPRLSTPARVVAPTKAATPAWMSDFEDPVEPVSPGRDANRPRADDDT